MSWFERVDEILERLRGLDEDGIADELRADPDVRAFVAYHLEMGGVPADDLSIEDLAEQWHFATSDDDSDDGGSGVSS